LKSEYKEILVNIKDPIHEKEEFEKGENKILRKSLEKRDLTQLFTTFVTPLVGRTIQTPEFRSSLSKTIRFRKIQNPGIAVKPAYDGAEKEAFKNAREYNISLGRKAKNSFPIATALLCGSPLTQKQTGMGRFRKLLHGLSSIDSTRIAIIGVEIIALRRCASIKGLTISNSGRILPRTLVISIRTP